MTITFPVDLTQQDIAAGRENNCWACPAALAFNRCLPPFLRPHLRPFGPNYGHVLPGFITASVQGVNQLIPLPQSAKDFIAAFDAGLPVQPITFDLTITITILPTP